MRFSFWLLTFCLSMTTVEFALAKAASKSAPFLIVTNPNPNGKNTKQIITGLNSHTITLDTNEDGYMDYWESQKGDLLVKAENPYKGQFQKLTAEKRMKKGTQVFEFALTWDKKRYRLVSKKFKPYVAMHLDELKPLPAKNSIQDIAHQAVFNPNPIPTAIVCPKNPAPVKKAITSWQDILAAVSEDSYDERRKFVKCALNKYQKFIFEPNCFDSKFASSMPDMIDGFAEVLLSSMPDSKSTDRPKFLACLKNNHLEKNDANIEQEFYQRMFNGCLAIANAKNKLASCGGTVEKFKAQLKENAASGNDCSPQPIPENYHETEKKLFSCGYSPVKTVNGKTVTDYGEYDPDTRQISLYRTSNEITSRHQSSASHGYAATMFHEMLHMSGLDDTHETYVRNIEFCCGDGLGPDNQDCKDMAAKTRQIQVIGGMSDIFRTKLSGYSSAESATMGIFDSGTSLEVNKYFVDLEKHSVEDRKVFDSCVASAGPSCDSNCSLKCDQSYRDQIAKHTREFWAKECKYYKKSNKAKVDCGALADEWVQVATSRPLVCGANQRKSTQFNFKNFSWPPEKIFPYVEFVLRSAEAQEEVTCVNDPKEALSSTIYSTINFNESYSHLNDQRLTTSGSGVRPAADNANLKGGSGHKAEMAQATSSGNSKLANSVFGKGPGSSSLSFLDDSIYGGGFNSSFTPESVYQGPPMVNREEVHSNVALEGTPYEASNWLQQNSNSSDNDFELGSNSYEAYSGGDGFNRDDSSDQNSWMNRMGQFVSSQAGIPAAIASGVNTTAKGAGSASTTYYPSNSAAPSIENQVGAPSAAGGNSTGIPILAQARIQTNNPTSFASTANGFSSSSENRSSASANANSAAGKTENSERNPASVDKPVKDDSDKASLTAGGNSPSTNAESENLIRSLVTRDPQEIIKDIQKDPQFVVKLIDQKILFTDENGRSYGEMKKPVTCLSFNKYSRKVQKVRCRK